MNFVTVADGRSPEFPGPEEFQNYLQKHIVPESKDHSRLFAYSGKTPMSFLESMSVHFDPSFNSFNTQLAGIAIGDATNDGFSQLSCICDECKTKQGLCERAFMVANFEYFMPQSFPMPRRTHTIGLDGSRVSDRGRLQQPRQVVQNEGDVTFERERPEDNTNFRLRRVNFQFLQRHPPLSRLETFAVGLDPGRSKTAQTCPAAYIAIEVQSICDGWDILMDYSKSMLSLINREISTDGNEIKQELVRRLFHTLDIWETIQEIHRNQVGSLQFLKTFKGNECWFQDTIIESRGAADGENDESFQLLQRAVQRLEAVGIDRLVLDTNTLISKTYNLISIDEAYRSRKQNTSIKRLTWITFIFLPLLFVASLYGMNIDLTANNPAYTTVFFFAVPLLVFLIICVLVLKNLHRIRNRFGAWERIQGDIEMQELNDVAAEGVTDAYSPPSWIAGQRILNSQFPNGFGNVRAMSSALVDAAASGRLEMVERLLVEGADLNAEDGVGDRSPLLAATEGGYLEVVDRLLQGGANINAIFGPNNRTALRVAASSGCRLVVERLLKHGTNISIDGAMIEAAWGGHLDVLECLLEGGADLNSTDGDDGFTALAAAAGGGHLDIVERLLQRGANANSDGAMVAAAETGQLEVMERLLRGGANFNSAGPLAAAAEGGCLQAVEWLLQVGVKITSNTALLNAAMGGHLQVVELLFQAETNHDVDMGLFKAATSGHLEVVKFFLQRGADINARRGYGRTTFTEVARNGHAEVVEFLLQAGTGHNVDTALLYAAKGGHLEVLKLLLQWKESVDAEEPSEGTYEDEGDYDLYGCNGSPLVLAACGGHTEVVEHLLQRGTDSHVGQALVSAAECGHLAVVKFLLRSPVGRTRQLPLEAAAHGGHLTVVEWLLERKENQDLAVPLVEAASQGHLELVERLLKTQVDLITDLAVQKAKSAATAGAHHQVVRVLEKAAK